MISQEFFQEAFLWQSMSHLNVVPFLGLDSETFEKTGCLTMVSPWMEKGSLENYIHSNLYNPAQETLPMVSSTLTHSFRP
jgi:serine/threonine protein kinase